MTQPVFKSPQLRAVGTLQVGALLATQSTEEALKKATTIHSDHSGVLVTVFLDRTGLDGIPDHKIFKRIAPFKVKDSRSTRRYDDREVSPLRTFGENEQTPYMIVTAETPPHLLKEAVFNPNLLGTGEVVHQRLSIKD